MGPLLRLRQVILARLARILLSSDTFSFQLQRLDPRFDELAHLLVRDLAQCDDRDALLIRDLMKHRAESMAETLQDIWVLSELDWKQGGFFVEFGVCDGRFSSNTILLERAHHWRGIVCEPDPRWHAELRRNRTAVVDLRCVAARSGEHARFSINETRSMSFMTHAGHRQRSAAATAEINIETVDLNDLLAEHGAPSQIDYISIDTEGAETEILSTFDFTRWDVKLFTIEHNFGPQQAAIDRIMADHGYERRFIHASRQDGWYRHNGNAAEA